MEEVKMGISREALRREAKKIYKENTKSIQKRNRIPFSEFFKKYRKMKNTEKTPEVEVPDVDPEDFDFENFVNVNQIDDDSLEVEEEIEAIEENENS
jgi:hypothetical protein